MTSILWRAKIRAGKAYTGKDWLSYADETHNNGDLVLAYDLNRVCQSFGNDTAGNRGGRRSGNFTGTWRLRLRGGCKKEDYEFTLEDEQAKTIFNLFYNHEMQINDSPAESVETLAFQICEDRLGTSMGGLRTLSGRINGKLVTVELSDQEYETVYQIISQYAPDVP